MLPVPDPRVCTEYFRSDLVATVDVLASRLLYGKEGGGEEIYIVRSRDVFRGQAAGKFEIRARLDSGRGSLTVGQPHLVFAVIGQSEVELGKDTFFIFGGGNTGVLSANAVQIGQIQQIQKALPNAFNGNVRGYIYPYPFVAKRDVKFVARSGTKSFSAISDGQGWFEFMLAPGTYRIYPKSDENLIPYDLSYDTPEKIQVKAGQCYEVAFRGKQ